MTTFSTQNIQDLITYPFKDPRWKEKLAVLAIVCLISVLIPVLSWFIPLGYLAAVMRAARSQRSLPVELPGWGDFGGLSLDGLRLMGVSIVYGLPSVAAMIAAYASMFSMAFADMNRFNFDYGYQLPFFPVGGIIGFFLFFGAAMLFGLVFSLFSPAVMVHTAVQRDFGAAFRFREWWRIYKANWAAFLIALMLAMGVTYLLLIAQQILMLTIVLICLAPFISAAISAYLLVVSGALFGAAYREGEEKLAAAVVPAALMDTRAQPDPDTP